MLKVKNLKVKWSIFSKLVGLQSASYQPHKKNFF